MRQAPSLASALDAVQHHHERVDGTGYPDGLRGDGISLRARVVAVADVDDALTSPRDYRPAWTPGRALSHMAAARGSHFDARCLDAFLALQQEQGHRPDGELGQDAHVVAALAACHADAPSYDHPHPAEPAAAAPALEALQRTWTRDFQGRGHDLRAARHSAHMQARARG